MLGFERRRYGWLFLATAGLLVFLGANANVPPRSYFHDVPVPPSNSRSGRRATDAVI